MSQNDQHTYAPLSTTQGTATSRRPWLIVVGGNIGAGKTTIAKHTLSNLGADFVPEIYENNFLAQCIERGQHGFEAQLWFVVDRFRAVLNGLRSNRDVVMVDRHVWDTKAFSEALYRKGTIDAEQRDTLFAAAEVFEEFLGPIDCYVLINTEPEFCLKNIAKRNRGQWEARWIKRDYLTLIKSAHEDLLQSRPPRARHVIVTKNDFGLSPEVIAGELLEQIESLMKADKERYSADKKGAHNGDALDVGAAPLLGAALSDGTNNPSAGDIQAKAVGELISNTTIYNGQMIVGVGGNIGAGKTTAIQNLRELMPSLVVVGDEIFAHNPFFGRPERESESQVYFALERTKAFWRAATSRYDLRAPLLVDRTMFDNRVFIIVAHRQGLLSDDQRDLLLDLNLSLEEILPPQDLYIYLNAHPERCIERIKKRGRKEEQRLTVSDLKEIGNAFESLINDRRLAPRAGRVVEIDVNDASPMVVAQKMMTEIMKVRSQHFFVQEV